MSPTLFVSPWWSRLLSQSYMSMATVHTADTRLGQPTLITAGALALSLVQTLAAYRTW